MRKVALQKHGDRLKYEFNLDGYVSIPAFFDESGIEGIRPNKDRCILDIVPTMPSSEVYYDDKENVTTLKRLQKPGEYDSSFA